MTKICTKCFTEKSLRYFFKKAATRDGHSPWCKACGEKGSEEWRLRHREHYLERKRNWRQKNPDHKRNWDRENREAVVAYQKIYVKNRLQSDPNYRLIHSQRVRIRRALKGLRKSARTMELVGCSIEFLRAHLESLFQVGMTWENQGKWHIDHKVPLSKFDLQDAVQLRAACHWTNLQPLWAGDNLRKGAKILS